MYVIMSVLSYALGMLCLTSVISVLSYVLWLCPMSVLSCKGAVDDDENFH